MNDTYDHDAAAARMYPSLSGGRQEKADAPAAPDPSLRSMYPSLYGKAAQKPTQQPERAVRAQLQEDAAARKMYADSLGHLYEKRDDLREQDDQDRRDDRRGQQQDQRQEQPRVDLTDKDVAEAFDASLQDAEVRTAAKVMGELGLDRAGAQKLAELQQKANAAYWEREYASYERELMSDPDQHLVQDALDLVQSFAPDLPKQVPHQLSHPAVVRFLAAVRRSMET